MQAVWYHNFSNEIVIESQKGAITIQTCFIEYQKGAVAIDTLYSDCALLVLNRTSLNTESALLALIWRNLWIYEWM